MKKILIKEFAEELKNNDELKNLAAAAAKGGKDQLCAFASEHGYDLDFEPATGALSDDALEAVNGGAGEVIQSQEWYKWLLGLFGMTEESFKDDETKETAEPKKNNMDLDGKIIL